MKASDQALRTSVRPAVLLPDTDDVVAGWPD